MMLLDNYIYFRSSHIEIWEKENDREKGSEKIMTNCVLKERRQNLQNYPSHIIHRIDMSNFSCLVSGKIFTAYIHGILAFPCFCMITRSRLILFFIVLTNYPRTSRRRIRKFWYGRQIEFTLSHHRWNGIQLLVIWWIGGSWLEENRA